MYKNSWVILIFLSLFLLSCNDNSGKSGDEPTAQNTDDSLFHAVMEGHDEAMAKMGKLIGTIKTVKQKLDSIEKLPGLAKKSKPAMELRGIYDQLQKAEAAMNGWMDKFNLDSATNVSPARDQYLVKERVKVEAVRDSVFQALANADTLLGKLN